MTFEIYTGWFLAFTFRRGVGIDLEFPDDKPVWITFTVDDGGPQHTISEFDGMELLLPFLRITFGQLFELQRR